MIYKDIEEGVNSVTFQVNSCIPVQISPGVYLSCIELQIIALNASSNSNGVLMISLNSIRISPELSNTTISAVTGLV